MRQLETHRQRCDDMSASVQTGDLSGEGIDALHQVHVETDVSRKPWRWRVRPDGDESAAQKGDSHAYGFGDHGASDEVRPWRPFGREITDTVSPAAKNRAARPSVDVTVSPHR
jgi:hypothetical protein